MSSWTAVWMKAAVLTHQLVQAQKERFADIDHESSTWRLAASSLYVTLLQLAAQRRIIITKLPKDMKTLRLNSIKVNTERKISNSQQRYLCQHEGVVQWLLTRGRLCLDKYQITNDCCLSTPEQENTQVFSCYFLDCCRILMVWSGLIIPREGRIFCQEVWSLVAHKATNVKNINVMSSDDSYLINIRLFCTCFPPPSLLDWLCFHLLS